MGVVEQLPTEHKPYSAPRPIEKGDGVAGFCCGKPPLDDFLKQRALKNEAKASRTYVVTSQAGESAGRIVAYYTLAAGGVSHDECPTWARRNMPNPVPVIILSRLAVDTGHQAKRIGEHLLCEALQRGLQASRQIGARALVVHAIDDEAMSFYVRYGFQKFPTDGRTLFLPIETIARSL